VQNILLGIANRFDSTSRYGDYQNGKETKWMNKKLCGIGTVCLLAAGATALLTHRTQGNADDLTSRRIEVKRLAGLVDN
jgi:hypothetical protein